MRLRAFAVRNCKELLRDKLTLIMSLGFPLVLLVLLSVIQRNIPVEMFVIEELAPGVAVFGLSFISLFSGFLIAKDRTGSLMLRLYTAPMRAGDFILGYALPLLPLSLAQSAICLLAALIFGLQLNANLLLVLFTSVPAAVVYIALGLICGSVFNDKQVGGICGAILTNVTAWLSGIWFSVDMVGGMYAKIAKVLPFYHAVEAGRAAVIADAAMWDHLIWVSGWAVALTVAAVLVFLLKMREDH